MSPRLKLSPAGHEQYQRWRDAPTTEPDEVALVLEVLLAISEDGWPPTSTRGEQPTPRWLYFPDTHHPGQWIVAAAATLWVVVRLGTETFDFIGAMPPTPDQEELAPWMTQPPEPDND